MIWYFTFTPVSRDKWIGKQMFPKRFMEIASLQERSFEWRGFFQTIVLIHRHNPIASNLKYNTFTNRASFVLHRVASIFLLHNKMAINEMNLFQRKTISHLSSTFCVRNLCILEIFLAQNCGLSLTIINVTTLFKIKMEIACWKNYSIRFDYNTLLLWTSFLRNISNPMWYTFFSSIFSNWIVFRAVNIIFLIYKYLSISVISTTTYISNMD